MIYQLLAGNTPFQVSADVTDPIEAANSLLASQKSHRPQLRSINSHVNAELEKLVHDCLALNPAHRPQTMHELERRLRAQSRPAARVRRMVRARPLWAIFFSCAFLAACVWGAAAFMTRPPYHVRQVARGIAYQNDGQYQDALECFGRALESDPDDKRALFEQSRTYLMLNNLLAASAGFTRLAIESGDLASAAYTGYCFNLKYEPGAAIAWYRRALDSGYETIGLCNNLGISYALGRSTLGDLERFDAAEYFLNRAVELDPRSVTVRANLVTLAIMRYDRDPNCELKPAVKHLEVLLAAMPHDPKVMTGAVQLYSVLSLRDEAYVGKAMEAIKSSIRAGNGPTAQDLSKTRAFESLRRDPRFDEIVLTAGGAKSRTKTTLTTFIDPVGTGDKAVRVR
jgi:tetratricopeptide (TPR) repeat protein